MNDPVIRIVRGQADDEECVAVLMALLMSASRRARLPVGCRGSRSARARSVGQRPAARIHVPVFLAVTLSR